MRNKANKQITMVTSSVDHERQSAKRPMFPTSLMGFLVSVFSKDVITHVSSSPMTLNNINDEHSQRLTLENILGRVTPLGFKVISKTASDNITADSRLVNVPGFEQDLIEIAEGLGNKVAGSFDHTTKQEIYPEPIFDKIMFGNGTEISIDGDHVINRCIFKDSQSNHDCNTMSVFISSSEYYNRVLSERYLNLNLIFSIILIKSLRSRVTMTHVVTHSCLRVKAQF